MIYEKIGLDKDDENVYLEVYKADALGARICDALLVIPGGGYEFCSDREGEPIALSFLAKGINTFVLHYSVGEKAKFPRPLIEVSKAMKYIKDNAAKYNIDPERVFVTGFSAGGHLCASLGTLWHTKEIYDEIDMPYGYNKPKAVIPIYPVISGIVKGTHMGSFYNILGTNTPTKEELEKYSLEKYVDEKTVPMFLVHTAEDSLVSVRNSLVMAQALTDAGISYELHIYQEGVHGIALANKITSCGQPSLDKPNVAKWVDIAYEWMENIK
ncbi:MAG: alpha/beta hydrolase [Bacillota bacterium]|nr:alpha/beta hydrolase [Bacillota bacterium]